MLSLLQSTSYSPRPSLPLPVTLVRLLYLQIPRVSTDSHGTCPSLSHFTSVTSLPACPCHCKWQTPLSSGRAALHGTHTSSLLIHLLMGHLSCFDTLATGSNGATNISLHLFSNECFCLSGEHPEAAFVEKGLCCLHGDAPVPIAITGSLCPSLAIICPSLTPTRQA